MAPPISEFERELQRLEAMLKQLEHEYTQYFSGRQSRPPLQTRSALEALVKQHDRRHIQNTGERFRFHTIQSRYRTLTDLWDRGMRAREEGGAGPFAQRRGPARDDKTETDGPGKPESQSAVEDRKGASPAQGKKAGK